MSRSCLLQSCALGFYRRVRGSLHLFEWMTWRPDVAEACLCFGSLLHKLGAGNLNSDFTLLLAHTSHSTLRFALATSASSFVWASTILLLVPFLRPEFP
jgi:hypothetical protein